MQCGKWKTDRNGKRRLIVRPTLETRTAKGKAEQELCKNGQNGLNPTYSITVR